MVELYVRSEGYLYNRVERHDPHGHVVQTEWVVVERLAIHVHHEGVANNTDTLATGTHEHSRAVDGDMAARIGQYAEDCRRFGGNRPLDLDPFGHGRTFSRDRQG